MADVTPPSSRWPLWAGLAAALGALVLLVEVVPRAAEAAELFVAWRAEASRFEDADPATRDRLIRERDRLATETEDALVELPGPDDLAVILDALQTAADSAGVVVTGVEPGVPRPEAGFETVPVRVSVRGDGHGVGRFVSGVERAPLLLKVRALAVSGPGLGPGPTTATVDVDALRTREGSGG